MPKMRLGAVNVLMERLAHFATRWAGSSWAFWIAALLVAAWLISGPFFGFTDTWQLVMNTISSIVTFLMVFLLQRSQNKESLAIQLKLNELIGSQRGADNRMINVENLTEAQVQALHERYERLAEIIRQTGNRRGPVTIEKAIKAAALAEAGQPIATEKTR